MILSAVVDPSAFNYDAFLEESYRLNAIQFLRGVLSNGLAVVDSERILWESLIKEAQRLPSKAKDIEVLIDQIYKKNRMVTSKTALLHQKISADSICQVKQESHADSLIAGRQTFKELNYKYLKDNEIIPLSEYIDSDFEKKASMVYGGSAPNKPT